jgi:hypothetical protein
MVFIYNYRISPNLNIIKQTVAVRRRGPKRAHMEKRWGPGMGTYGRTGGKAGGRNKEETRGPTQSEVRKPI